VLVSVHAGELLDFTALLPSNPADLITPGRALSDGLGNESLVLGTSGSFVSGYLMNSMVPDLSQAEQAGYGAATGERLFLVVWDRTTFAGQAPASGAALCVVPLWVDGDPATPATTYGDLPPSLPTWAKPATGATQFRCDQTLVPATEFALTLTVGWNLISLPVTPLAPAPETCFGSAVAGAVWEWQTGRNGGAYGQSTALAPGRGYWVEGTVAGPVVIRGRAPPPQSLGLGSSAWHLLGPLSSRPLTVARDGPTAGSLWRWDGMSQAYRSVDIAATLEVGSGYWFYAASDVTLTLDVDGRGTR
jgi:hypothetical protein